MVAWKRMQTASWTLLRPGAASFRRAAVVPQPLAPRVSCVGAGAAARGWDGAGRQTHRPVFPEESTHRALVGCRPPDTILLSLELGRVIGTT